MAILIYCDCGGKFEAKASSLKIENLGDGAYRLTARCPNCGEKSMANIIPRRPDSPALGPPPPGLVSPFAETVAEILREEGCMPDENEPPGPTPPRSAPFGPQPEKKY